MFPSVWQRSRRAIMLFINPFLILFSIDSPSKYFNKVAKQDLAPAQVDGFLAEHQAPHIAEAFTYNVDKVCSFILDEQTLVLDVGCGTGRYLRAILERYPQIPLYGIDVSAATLQNYTQELAPAAKLQVADFAQENPFPAMQFDLVYSLGVLQHIQFFKLRMFFTHIHAVTKPGGYFYFVFAPGENWWDILTNRRFYRYPPKLVKQQLLKSGFGIEESGVLTSSDGKNMGYFFVATPNIGP